jgi:hypothetical protein
MALTQSDFEVIRVAKGFPAPLCEACNEPMGFRGEYTPTVYGKIVFKREYQCRGCGAELAVQRSKAFV